MIRFQLQGELSPTESFPLPQAGLYADFDAATGCVALTDEFRSLPGIAKLAIIAGWQKSMEQERRLAVVSLYREVTEAMGEVGMPAKISQFREVCAQVGFECPTDIAIVLQQV